MIFCEWTRKDYRLSDVQSNSFKGKTFVRDGEAHMGIFEHIHAVLNEMN